MSTEQPLCPGSGQASSGPQGVQRDHVPGELPPRHRVASSLQILTPDPPGQHPRGQGLEIWIVNESQLAPVIRQGAPRPK